MSFTPGARFFLDGSGEGTARLSFSSVPARRIDEGVRRLAEAIGDWRRSRSARPAPDGLSGSRRWWCDLGSSPEATKGAAPMIDTNGLRIADRKHIGLAEMLKGGVIMDVTNAEQARIAEQAGAASVMALERVPADIRRDGGVARMAAVGKIREIQQTVSIPVMAKARIGHFVEAQILEALGVDFIDESEVLTPADEHFHIDKLAFRVPFVCGARDLGEALRRIGEGAAMIRTKGEAGSGNIVEAVRHMRALTTGVRRLAALGAEELMAEAKAPRRALRPGPLGRGEPAAAGAELLRRRDRDPGRRGPHDAARGRGGVRRLRASSSRATRSSGPAPSCRRRRTSGTRTCSRG